MLSAKELMWIKQRQKEYFELFSKKLNIDFSIKLKNKSKSEVDNLFKQMVDKYNPDLDKLLNRKQKLNLIKDDNEKQFLINYSNDVISNGMHICYAASLINRDKSNIYHYAGKK